MVYWHFFNNHIVITRKVLPFKAYYIFKAGFTLLRTLTDILGYHALKV